MYAVVITPGAKNDVNKAYAYYMQALTQRQNLPSARPSASSSSGSFASTHPQDGIQLRISSAVWCSVLQSTCVSA